MKINSIRSLLYLFGRILGDVAAVKNGTIGKRIGRRIVGKASGRAIGKLFK